MTTTVDLLARSGIVGQFQVKNFSVSEPTQVKILGYVSDANGKILNTRQYPLINPTQAQKKEERAKLILLLQIQTPNFHPPFQLFIAGLAKHFLYLFEKHYILTRISM
jgi:hypothetical protein